MSWRAFTWKLLFVFFAPFLVYSAFYVILFIFGIKKIPTLFDSLLMEALELGCIIYAFGYYKHEIYNNLNNQALKFKRILILFPLSILARIPIVLIFGLLAVFNFLPGLSKSLDAGVKFQWSDLVQPTGLGFPIDISLALFITVILTPITEELLFRAGIFRFLHSRMSTTKAMLLSAAIFSLAHIYVGLFIGTFILGLCLSWVYFKWGNIKYAILLHALFNLLPFLTGTFSK